jgi:predicted GTPase
VASPRYAKSSCAELCVAYSRRAQFINKASGSNLLVGRSLESCTRDVQTSLPFVVSGRIVTLIDTPGFDDTDRSDTAILNMIAAYLSKTYVIPLQ